MRSEDPGPDRRAPGSAPPQELRARPFRPAALVPEFFFLFLLGRISFTDGSATLLSFPPPQVGYCVAI